MSSVKLCPQQELKGPWLIHLFCHHIQTGFHFHTDAAHSAGMPQLG
jgi:hypothetical protein